MSDEDKDTAVKKIRVAMDEDLRGGLWVSTIKLPINHKWGDGPDLWYETMVFPEGSYTEIDGKRYTTEEEARAGHADFVARVMAGEYEAQS